MGNALDARLSRVVFEAALSLDVSPVPRLRAPNTVADFNLVRDFLVG